MGLHCIGFLADTTSRRRTIFSPAMRIPSQRSAKSGMAPNHRAQFDATRGATGALIIGDAKTVTEKILYINEALGDISRITFQMGVSTLPHAKMTHAIASSGPASHRWCARNSR